MWKLLIIRRLAQILPALFFYSNKKKIMQNPLANRQHIKEYLITGFVAALLYTACVLLFLRSNNYEHLYYLFIGCCLFMPVIFYYNLRLIKRPYEGKRAASMLIAGHAATLVGVVLSVIFSCICIWFFFSNNDVRSAEQVLPNNHPGILCTGLPACWP